MSYNEFSLTGRDLVEIDRLLDQKMRKFKDDLFFLFLKVVGGAIVLATWGVFCWTIFGLK